MIPASVNLTLFRTKITCPFANDLVKLNYQLWQLISVATSLATVKKLPVGTTVTKVAAAAVARMLISTGNQWKEDSHLKTAGKVAIAHREIPVAAREAGGNYLTFKKHVMENSRGQNRNLDQQRNRLSENEQYSGQQNVSSNRGSRQRQESLEEQNENVQGDSFDQQNVSTPTRGGTNDISRNSGATPGTERGRTNSGISTKRNVTGSDYDGQVSPE
jgi:Sec-independent protein translocase protein TatA